MTKSNKGAVLETVRNRDWSSFLDVVNPALATPVSTGKNEGFRLIQKRLLEIKNESFRGEGM